MKLRQDNPCLSFSFIHFNIEKMTQEIKVNLTLTLEGEASESKKDITDFIGDMMINVINTKTFSLVNYHIGKIQEEAEIYQTETDCLTGVWEFVEKYYPDYYRCNEIMRNDDLCKIVNGELNGAAVGLFAREFDNDPNQAAIAFDQSSKYVYERAIMGYLHQQQDTISIVWSLEDVESRAKDNGYTLKDGEAMKVLTLLKEKHDCNLGITWDTVDDYLSYIVPDSDQDDGFSWTTITFEGKNYECRLIADLENKGTELCVAPAALSIALRLDEHGEGDADAIALDETIAFYATEEEMAFGDVQLFNWIYN